MSQDNRLNQSSTFSASAAADDALVTGMPHLTWSNSTHSLAIDIPAIAETGYTWTVAVTDLEGETTTRVLRAAAGDEEPLLVALSQPFARIDLALGEHFEATFIGATAQSPYIVLDDRARLVDAQQGLFPAHYVLLAPAGTVVSGVSGVSETHHAHGEWDGWAAWNLDVEGASEGSELSLITPQVGAASFAVTAPAAWEWGTDVATLPNARGLDHRPVFKASPTVTITQPGEWVIQLVYAPLGGEREAISDETVGEGTFEIFPSDLYEDPWVGRYEVGLLRDGEQVDMRVFSIAEALHMRAKNEGPRGTGFRFIDAAGQLSPFSYTLASAPGKAIVFDKGTREFEPTETSRIETVASEAGYELDFRVTPATLRTRVKLTGTEPTESFDKQVIYASLLDADAALTVYSPQPLPLAKFVAIDKRQKMKSLASTAGSTQSHRNVSLSNRALRHAVRKQSSMELYLLWSTLSYEDFLDSLDSAARSRHLAQAPERRVVEYEASAASDLIYAAIATVKRAPLITGATLSETHVELSFNEEEEEISDLLAWAWPLNDPARSPERLVDLALPSSLQDAGPLIIDARAEEPLTDLSAPAHPAPNAVIAEAPGEVSFADATVDEAWAAYAALEALATGSRNARIESTFAAVLERLRGEPGAAIRALPASGLSLSRQAKALAQTQLVAHPWNVGVPAGAAPELSLAFDSGIDSLTRPLLLMKASGPDATPSSTAINDEAARIAALRECFAHDEDFYRLGSVSHLRGDAQKLAGVLAQLGFDTSVSHTLVALGAFGGGDTPYVSAAWMPYISYIFALAFRAVAAGLLPQPAVLAILQDDLPQLADAAALAPALFAYDLRTAEGLTQYLCNNR